jgi:hypothetical protein
MVGSEIRIMCLNGATFLSADCCFNELALKNSTKRIGLVQSRPHHHVIENNLAELSLNNSFRFSVYNFCFVSSCFVSFRCVSFRFAVFCF